MNIEARRYSEDLPDVSVNIC